MSTLLLEREFSHLGPNADTTGRFYAYYMISGKTMVGPELDNKRYPKVKPVTWEDFIKEVPLTK